METVDVNSNEKKVYRFDERVYRKSNRKNLISDLSYQFLFTAMYAALFCSLYFILGLKPIYLLFLIVFAIHITKFIWTLSKYFRAKRVFGNDLITIKMNNDIVKSVHVCFREMLCEIYYHIININDLKRKKYIDIKGYIEKEYVYDKDISVKEKRHFSRKQEIDGVEQRESLRIPAYFEGMDEIYEALERMKGQGRAYGTECKY